MQPNATSTVLVPQPQSDEYNEFYGDYVARAGKYPDVLAQLVAQRTELSDLLRGVSDEQALRRPGRDEWTLKGVIGHLGDSERIFSYRALRFSRKDPTPLPGFEQENYTREASFDALPIADLLAEWDHLRAATILMFRAIPADRYTQRGTASNSPITLRAMLYIIVGHADQHLESLRTEYLPLFK